MGADIQKLTESLRSGDEARCRDAAEQLSRMGGDAQPAAVALVEACASGDDETRELVVAALEELGAPPAEDAPRLAALLTDARLDVAYWAATLLGRLRKQAASAVATLTKALADHPEMAVRQRAACALGEIGAGAAAARAALETAAADGDQRLATLAREALAKIGK
ncbi:MAG: HEAT repeat domain-containing protein [Pirellulales bacterium]